MPADEWSVLYEGQSLVGCNPVEVGKAAQREIDALRDEIERLRTASADAERRAREWRNIVAINIEKSKTASPF